MAAAAAITSRVTNVLGGPVKHFVQGEFTIEKSDGTSKTFSITPILLRDRKDATEFLRNFSDEFYRDGKPLPENRVVSRVDAVIKRFIKGEAWSAWLVRDEKNTIAAWWTIGYDDNDNDLQAALMVQKGFQNEKIASAIWEFTKSYIFPVFVNQGAKVGAQEDLRKVNLYALCHPDHKVMATSLEKAGFKEVSREHDPAFEGELHDGSRIRWIIPVAEILDSNKK